MAELRLADHLLASPLLTKEILIFDRDPVIKDDGTWRCLDLGKTAFDSILYRG
jgi:hypothetical protein